MAYHVFKLTHLSCQHCVHSVQKILQDLGIEQAEVSLNFAKVKTDLAPELIIAEIQKANFGAEIAKPDLSLALSGLSCCRCVKKVEQGLSDLKSGGQNFESFLVSKTQADFYSLQQIESEKIISAIENLGYQALPIEKLEKSEKINIQPKIALIQPMQQTNLSLEPDNQNQVHLLLDGLNCAACVLKVEKALQAVENVEKVRVNLAEQTAFVAGDASPDALIQAVVQAGYGAELIEDEQQRREKQQQQAQQEIKQRKWQASVALVFGFGLMIWGFFGGMMVALNNQMLGLSLGVVTLLIMILAGGHFYRRAWQNLGLKSATMDSLVAVGTGMAWLYSMAVVLKPDFFPMETRHLYFESSAMIIGLINLGKMLETKGKQRSSLALARLLELTPKTTKIIDEQGEREIPLADVKVGMILRLQAGNVVAVDGVVTGGEVWVDQSMLTGEVVPVKKSVGDKVVAGTLVTDGGALFKAEQIGQQTQLAKIIRLVRNAQSSKPQMGQLADKIAAVFVPAVIGIALISAGIWYFYQQDISYSLVVFSTVLIIACPCSLGLATPMSIIAGITRGAELGVLIRDADALQKATEIDTIVFDKTGTLTEGRAEVTGFHNFSQLADQFLISLAANLEQHSSHPLAKAIVNFAENKEFDVQIKDFSHQQGLGVVGVINGQKVRVGNRQFLQQAEIDCQQAENIYRTESNKGATVVFIAIEQQLCGIFIIRDQLRADSINAIKRLKDEGYHLVMLSGDQKQTAQVIADELGIKQVIAGVLPAEKLAHIQKLQQQGKKLLMVGDGINDAPALAQADVSIAMGSGSDIAVESADLTLINPSINRVADSLLLAKATLANMKQNLFFAFIYNLVAIPLAAGAFYPWFGTLLNPMIGGAAMALSSITVVSNANRLLKFHVKK